MAGQLTMSGGIDGGTGAGAGSSGFAVGPWAMLGGALLGGIAGAQPNVTNSSSNATSGMNLLDFNQLSKGQSGLEAATYQGSLDSFNQFQNLVNAGPGTQAITDANQFMGQYTNQLQTLMSQGAMPNQQQIGQAQQYAQSMFAPQQTALNQQFNQQRIDNQRLAARLGRPGSDPILANKLAFSQGQQQQQLSSQQGALASDTAMQMPQMQANYLMRVGGAISNVKQGLASQAFQNRQALLAMGNQLMQGERNYRINTANRYSTSSGTQSGGGGVGGAIAGALGGIGSMASSFGV